MDGGGISHSKRRRLVSVSSGLVSSANILSASRGSLRYTCVRRCQRYVHLQLSTFVPWQCKRPPVRHLTCMNDAASRTSTKFATCHINQGPYQYAGSLGNSCQVRRASRAQLCWSQ
jgi:hypothetical protein